MDVIKMLKMLAEGREGFQVEIELLKNIEKQNNGELKEYTKEEFNEGMEKIIEGLDYLMARANDIQMFPFAMIVMLLKGTLLQGPDAMMRLYNTLKPFSMMEFLRSKAGDNDLPV